MIKVKNLFDDFMKKKVEKQLIIIDQLCEDMEIDPTEWFNSFIQNTGDYSGTDFLNDFLSNFLFYISGEIQTLLLKSIKPDGYNMYKKPYIHNNLDLSEGYWLIGPTHETLKFEIKEKKKNKFLKLLDPLTLEQKSELLENKIFSYIIDATKLKIISDRDMRYLKLKKLEKW